ncbi:MAG: peptidoglycan DD-metalloendopeptidase family protein [candidate division Zixibacteria bacterium]|nr:peptidoglycan DD-metalloendopeptidase family protein [candidate division Zixibacteria bacterium]
MADKEKKPRQAWWLRRRMNLMVVPHGRGRNRSLYVHGFVLALLLLASAAVLILAGLMVSDYWRNVLKISQLAVYERRDREESYKLEVMEKGLEELGAKAAEVDEQYDVLIREHRLNEVRPPEDLSPRDGGEAGGPLDDIERRLERLEKNFRLVRRRFEDDPGALASIPSIMPCRGWLYRDFGNTISPFTGRVEMHRGLDVVAPRGTPVVATAAGVVTFAGLDEHYGLTVEVDHGNGFQTHYAHNMRNAAQAGTRVKRGQVVAYVGSTGRSSCTHVHYEARKNGVAVNPRYFILREPRSPAPEEPGPATI